MSQNLQEEKWKDIEGFEDLYAVSDRGRVMNLKSRRMLKPSVDNFGYEYVKLYNNGKRKWYRIHRLVAQAFIENLENLPQINHRDEDKRNNDVTNLEWSSALHNVRYSTHQRSCKINQFTLDGEFIKWWNSITDIERETDFNNSYIVECCKGRGKTAYGYRWEYADGLHQQKRNRPIVVLSKEDDFIAQFKSVAEASRCLGISDTQIRNVIKGSYKTTHNLKFKYLDELSKGIKNEDEKLNNDAQIDYFN